MKTNSLRLVLPVYISFILIISCLTQVKAQHVVQLSGLVTYTDTTENAAGVAVFVPHTSRGTYTNQQGFFSLPVLPGDSVVVAALGYEKQYILIPESIVNHSYSVSTKLLQGSIKLPTVDVMPWATERDFKMAVARLKLPQGPTTEVNMNIVQEKIKRTNYPMDGSANQKHSLQQQNRQMQGRYMVPSDVKLLSIPIRYK